MTALLMAAGSALAAWAGMGVLCFQSPSQRRRLGLPEQTGRQRWPCAMAAATLIAVSLAAAVADGVPFALVLWLCQAGLLGLALICTLPFARRGVTASMWVAALLALLVLAAARWM